MAGVLSGLMMLLIAVLGFYWDVAWHIDHGRDEQLFTPSHVMIVVGLAGLVFAAAVSAVFATLERAGVGFSALGLRVPWSALSLGVMGAGALGAFPLDNLWHQAYGLDVTLWSPTHLQLVGGGALATLAVLLMIAEALPGARPTAVGRAVMVMAAGAALVGMTTFQGEFDFGVPQFQVVYLPILIAAAAAFTLVFARFALGRWGALKATAFYLLLRGLIALVVAVALNHTFPRFPLYLPSALAVEAAAPHHETHLQLHPDPTCGRRRQPRISKRGRRHVSHQGPPPGTPPMPPPGMPPIIPGPPLCSRSRMSLTIVRILGGSISIMSGGGLWASCHSSSAWANTSA